MSTGKRPSHVSEELALEEFPGNRGAIHRDESRCSASALRVNGASDELFADAGFSLDEYGGRCRRNHIDGLQNAAQLLARANKLARRGVRTGAVRARCFPFCTHRPLLAVMNREDAEGQSSERAKLFDEDACQRRGTGRPITQEYVSLPSGYGDYKSARVAVRGAGIEFSLGLHHRPGVTEELAMHRPEAVDLPISHAPEKRWSLKPGDS